MKWFVIGFFCGTVATTKLWLDYVEQKWGYDWMTPTEVERVLAA